MAFHYFGQLIQTPSWRSIIFWKDDQRYIRIFYCFNKRKWDLISSVKFVIYVSFDVSLTQSSTKMAREIFASVFASEADENIICFLTSFRWEKERSSSRRSHWWFTRTDTFCWEKYTLDKSSIGGCFLVGTLVQVTIYIGRIKILVILLNKY